MEPQTSINQPRQPQGTPVGGQFAGKANPESELALTGDLSAAINPDQQLYSWLRDVRVRLASGDMPNQVTGPFGTHGVTYGEETGEQYATVGFCLPDGVYAEVEDGTYGQLQGLRVILDGSGVEQDTHANDLPNDAPRPNVDKRVALPPDVTQSALWFTAQAVRDHFDEDVNHLTDAALAKIGQEALENGVVYAAFNEALREALDQWWDTHCACGNSLEDGEGWDGKCGTCADRADPDGR